MNSPLPSQKKAFSWYAYLKAASQGALANFPKNRLYHWLMRILTIFVGLLLLSLRSACAADAVPATMYFPILPLDALGDTVPQLVPVAANGSLAADHASITRAILLVHDDDRDANGAVATVSALAGSANATTIIMAPQFLLQSDVGRFADHLPDKGRTFATWQMSGWSSGDDSISSEGQKGISSFTVVDLMLMYLADQKSFPNLKTIVIAGYGAGANFVQRYSAFSLATDVMTKQNIDLRFIVANASSFLYLTAVRPLGGRKGFGIPDTTSCPSYNAYPFGLENLNTYARKIGANAAKTNYDLHFVTYLNANSPDGGSQQNCAIADQGGDQITRAIFYRLYLESLYGDVAAKTQSFLVNQATKSDPVSMFGSVCGMTVLFGDGICTAVPESTP